MLKTAARLFSVLVMLAGGLAATQPALAGEGSIATPAFTNHPIPLYYGPGSNYARYGTLPGGLKVYVDRCSGLWCRVHFDRQQGYVFLYALSFGRGPNSMWWPNDHYHHEPTDPFYTLRGR